MSQTDWVSFLSVGLQGLPKVKPPIDLQSVNSGRDALAALRVMECDMVLAGKSISDMTIWTLMQRIRTLWPGQRWAYIDPDMTSLDEIEARSLGATLLFQEMPEGARLFELGRSLLKRSAIPAANRPARQRSAQMS